MNERQRRIEELRAWALAHFDGLKAIWRPRTDRRGRVMHWIRVGGMLYDPAYFAIINQARLRYGVTMSTARDYAKLVLKMLPPPLSEETEIVI